MFTELGLGVAVAATTSFIACRLLIAAGLVDVPNAARKAHRLPTPTSGGLGVALGFALGMIAVSFAGADEWRASVGVPGLLRLSLATAFASAFMVLGFVDDARPLGPRAKFAVFVLLSIGGVLSVGVVEALPLGDGAILNLGPVIGLVGSALFVFTLVNSVNFMDGANGLAMGSVAIGLIALGAIALERDAPGAAAMAWCGAAALVGFLLWNYPSGRLFAGDSGALFAGALAALASLATVHNAGVSPFIPPVLFFPMLADVLLTLAWRVQQRRHVLSGHAEHIYQIGLRAGFTHARVSLFYWLAAALCGLIGFIAAKADTAGGWTSYAPSLALAGLACAALAISAMVRRFAVKRGMGEV